MLLSGWLKTGRPELQALQQLQHFLVWQRGAFRSEHWRWRLHA
jgi:hypothetical protein